MDPFETKVVRGVTLRKDPARDGPGGLPVGPFARRAG